MKKSIPVRLNPELHERAMRLIFWTPGLNFQKLMVLLLETYIDQEEAVRGAPYPNKEEWHG